MGQKHSRIKTYCFNSYCKTLLWKRCENLAQDVEDLNKSTSKTEKTKYANPPIFMVRVANIISLITLLKKIAKNEYEIKIINST